MSENKYTHNCKYFDVGNVNILHYKFLNCEYVVLEIFLMMSLFVHGINCNQPCFKKNIKNLSSEFVEGNKHNYLYMEIIGSQNRCIEHFIIVYILLLESQSKVCILF